MTWQTLKYNTKYDIMVEYPHRIRNKKTGTVLAECLNNDGYYELLGKTKQNLIAIQWIPNPNNYREVDHKDHDRTNNRIENLEWTSHSENIKNRKPFTRRPNEYIDELPDSIISIDEYKGNEYDKYWFDYENQKLIAKVRGGRLKFIKPSKTGGAALVVLIDINGNSHTVGYQKLVRTMNELVKDISPEEEEHNN